MKNIARFFYFILFGVVSLFHMPIDDYDYYIARVSEVVKGNWQIGNPYFIEHSKGLGISFFVPDILSAIPGSFIIFPILMAFLIYKFLQALKVSGGLLHFGTWFCFLISFNLISRLTSMQTVFPFFLIFLLALYSNKTWLTAITAGINFYIYPYLWQFTAIIFGIKFIYREFKYQYIFISLFALPSLYYLWQQISSPFYFQTMERIGLVYTRLPTISAFYYFLMLSPLMFLLRHESFFLKIYLSFSIILFSNVLTGMELETANHVGRFIILFGSISIIYLVSKYKKYIFLALIWLTIFKGEFSSLSPKIYIPKIENKYVIFNPYGGLHLMSSDEVQERYLVDLYPKKITVDLLVSDFRSFAGTGPAVHQIAQHNYKVKICKLLKANCGEIKTIKSYYGEEYFQKIISRYNNEICPNISLYYKKYNKDVLDELSK